MPADKAIAREKLILAGERLIALHGIEGLSLRKVNIAAGQKNTSAALYHFGSKEGLLLAIFDYRMEHVDMRRHQLLDDDSTSVRALIKAWVLPDCEEIAMTQGGSYHAQFLAVACSHPDFDLQALGQRPHASSYSRVADELRRLLPELPPEVFALRFGMAMLQGIYSMADQERLNHGSDASHQTSPALFVGNLIDVLEAIFTAPVSVESQAELALQLKTRASGG